MSNLSSGNSSEGGEEAQETRTSTTDGSSVNQDHQAHANKKRRKLPGNPDPSAEVIALSPKTLMAKNRFICEVCNKGFQREQNLQLHRRGHNLPWKLKPKTGSSSETNKKRVYICPEPSCIHHNPARALGDLTGIKKHYSRKHGEKKWKCEKCSKKYAVQSDWKAHSKTCGTMEYKCDCGTIFSRRDSFITHRAFCDALAEENHKVNQGLASTTGPAGTEMLNLPEIRNSNPLKITLPYDDECNIQNPPRQLNMAAGSMFSTSPRNLPFPGFQLGTNLSTNIMSATALLQQAAQMGATVSSSMINSPIIMQKGRYPNSSLFNGMQVPIIQNHETQMATSVHGFAGSMLHNGAQETSRILQNHEEWHNGLFNESQSNNGVEKINGDNVNHESLTLDFLGIGGMTHQQQQQEEIMSFDDQQQKVSDHQNIDQELNSMWDF